MQRSDALPVEQVSDIDSSLRIGVVRSDAVTDYLRELGHGDQLVLVDDLETGLKLLNGGGLEMLAGNLAALRFYQRNLGLNGCG